MESELDLIEVFEIEDHCALHGLVSQDIVQRKLFLAIPLDVAIFEAWLERGFKRLDDDAIEVR